QSLIGILTWVSPGVLPSAWLGRAGERTVGSLELPGTYTAAVLFGAILLVHYAFTASPTRRRTIISLAAAGLGFLMVFMTFSRASWLAGIVAALGLIWLHPKRMTRVVVVAIPILLLAIGAGLLAQQSQYAEARLNSNQTAIGRLPVMYAAVQMWQAQPLFGFGYGNFDRFDRDFQQEVAGYIPEADHASHNVYLTVLAEQGGVGILLFLGPPALAMAATVRAWRRLPPDAFVGRRLAGSLWLILTVHFVVNNFANMRSIFGLGMWWFLIALVLELVERPAAEPRLVAVDTESDLR
ncbi:MAG: O-antigen ligase family protein, partial [Acidimicrobiia bacterium]|nr:O-antigen ligase family protein [Acidimicrobiia bacterium]